MACLLWATWGAQGIMGWPEMPLCSQLPYPSSSDPPFPVLSDTVLLGHMLCWRRAGLSPNWDLGPLCLPPPLRPNSLFSSLYVPVSSSMINRWFSF